MLVEIFLCMEKKKILLVCSALASEHRFCTKLQLKSFRFLTEFALSRGSMERVSYGLTQTIRIKPRIKRCRISPVSEGGSEMAHYYGHLLRFITTAVRISR